MILKDRFLTQSAPDICYKLWKQVFGPNQSLKNCCSWLKWYIMAENMRWKIRGKKRTWQKTDAPTMAVRPALKQLEKNAQRDLGKKGWACCYCGKEGPLKRDCSQTSKLSPAPCPVSKGPWWRRDCPPRCRPQGWTLKTIWTEGVQGSPHKLPS